LATVVLPHLSQHHATMNEQDFSSTLDWALRCNLLIGIPAAVGLCVLAKPILITLLHYGKFTRFDVEMTAKSLQAFTLGLPAFMLIKILASAFYSRHNIKTPVKIAAFAMGVNIILNAVLILPMHHAGLALATSLSALFNAGLLIVGLRLKKILRFSRQWLFFLLQLLIANGAMAAVVWVLQGPINPWFEWSVTFKIVHLALLLIACFVGYLLMLWITGLRWRHFKPAD
jgi:putative peptidoglycan lipid II flippase